jgi:hypothetical protein
MHITQPAQGLPESVDATGDGPRHDATKESYPRDFCWLLRLGEMNGS